MPSSGLKFLFNQLNIKNKVEDQDAAVKSLLTRSDSREVLMTTYKSMFDYEELLKIWNTLLDSGIKLEDNNQSKTPLLIDLINYGYNVDVFVAALESMLKIHAEKIVNQRDKNGTTPLMAAAENGNEKVVTLLLQYGADRNAKNNNNKTAADIALDMQGKSVFIDADDQYAKVYQLLKQK